MAVENQWRRRIIGGILAGIMLLFNIGLCLSSCQLKNALTESPDNQGETSVQKDSYEAKVLYYETQVKHLITQLDQVEQQLYLLRSDYMDQLKQLEEQMNEQFGQQKPNEPTQPPANSDENTGTPPEDPPSNGPEEDTPTVQPDVTLCDYSYRLENGKAILTAYRGKEKEVVVPAAVDGYLVVGIGDNAFADSEIVSVILPQTIESLGWFSFYQCKNLKKIVLPSKISNIGYASFDGCSSSLCLYVVEGSYAELYAASFGLNYQNKS